MASPFNPAAFTPIASNDVRRIELFSALDDAQIARLLPLLRRRPFPLRATSLVKPEFESRVCFALSGRFRILANAQNGASATIYEFGAGGVFGHVAAVLGHNINGALRIVADESGDLAHMSAADFLTLMEEIPNLQLVITRSLAALARDYARQLFDLVALNVRERLIAELLRLSQNCVLENGDYVLKNAPTHHVIAASVGASRESVSRHLLDLERDKLISLQRGAIEYLNMPGLIKLDREAAGERFVPWPPR